MCFSEIKKKKPLPKNRIERGHVNLTYRVKIKYMYKHLTFVSI